MSQTVGPKPLFTPTRAGKTSDVKAAHGTNETEGVKGLSTTASADLPGHLPKITKVDVDNLQKASSKTPGITGAKIVAEVDIGIPASGITHLPSGETLLVNDNDGIARLREHKGPKSLGKPHKGADLEGIASDSKGKHVWVVDESDRRVHRYDVSHDKDGKLELKDADDARRLPKLKDVTNKGWEGLTFLSKEVLGGKHDALVCAHEGSPRRIGIYELPDLDTGVTLAIPDAAKKLLPDVADVAIDPKTGHILVVSDQSRTVVELAIKKQTRAASQGLLEQVELEVVSTIDLSKHLSKNDKPEGLAFDQLGRLWVALDFENDHKNAGKAVVLELSH